MTTHYLACDLGAESGRLMLGSISQGKLTMEELHRFANIPLKAGGSLHWNMPQLSADLQEGLRKAGQRKLPMASISTDSWGVDYVLLAPNDDLIPPTFHYRDPRSQRGVETAHAKITWEGMFEDTGLQFMPFNTVYQLMAEEPGRLQQAKQMLGIGDAFNFLLCGTGKAEVSFASTTQLYNPKQRAWSERLIQLLGLPRQLFPDLVPSGTKLGPLRPSLAAAAGLPNLQVVASCSHDTGAAVAAVPAGSGDWAYLSSGTWSLMGVELPEPVINDQCRKFNFTNEIGYGHSVRLLKNIVGLWIVQECRRHWEKQGQRFDYAQLTELAKASPPFVSLINPADPRFVSPDEMPSKVAAFCAETKQPLPQGPGPTIRCVLESLALLYRRTLGWIEQLIGKKVQRLHIVGGGSRNALLNQFTANAVQIPVLAGPAEATAAGNVLIQAISLGHLSSLADARQVMARSTEMTTFESQDQHPWQKAYDKFNRFFESSH